MVYIIFICFAVPLALMLPIIKGQSRWLILFMLLGAFMAVSASEINSVLRLLFQLPVYDVSLRIELIFRNLIFKLRYNHVCKVGIGIGGEDFNIISVGYHQ